MSLTSLGTGEACGNGAADKARVDPTIPVFAPLPADGRHGLHYLCRAHGVGVGVGVGVSVAVGVAVGVTVAHASIMITS
ncbi:MAG: hypothetical protein SF029_13500 [bacterium]|nr:hypothetical protein [bacterium]